MKGEELRTAERELVSEKQPPQWAAYPTNYVYRLSGHGCPVLESCLVAVDLGGALNGGYYPDLLRTEHL